MWQKKWPEACYSGTTTTAGNLVFVGRNAGELQAYNAHDGKQLWSFQTGAGANDTPTIFQQDGKEYVAFLLAGNSLTATPHGDNLWLFGLDGKIGPGQGAGHRHGHAARRRERRQDGDAGKGDAAAGKAVFAGELRDLPRLSPAPAATAVPT